MIALIMLTLDVNNILSVPWWLYVLATIAGAVEITVGIGRAK